MTKEGEEAINSHWGRKERIRIGQYGSRMLRWA